MFLHGLERRASRGTAPETNHHHHHRRRNGWSLCPRSLTRAWRAPRRPVTTRATRQDKKQARAVRARIASHRIASSSAHLVRRRMAPRVAAAVARVSFSKPTRTRRIEIHSTRRVTFIPARARTEPCIIRVQSISVAHTTKVWASWRAWINPRSDIRRLSDRPHIRVRDAAIRLFTPRFTAPTSTPWEYVLDDAMRAAARRVLEALPRDRRGRRCVLRDDEA